MWGIHLVAVLTLATMPITNFAHAVEMNTNTRRTIARSATYTISKLRTIKSCEASLG